MVACCLDIRRFVHVTQLYFAAFIFLFLKEKKSSFHPSHHDALLEDASTGVKWTQILIPTNF